MGKSYVAQRPHAGTIADRPHRAREVSQPVNGKYGSLVKRRNEIRTRQMGSVMLDPMELGTNTFQRYAKCCREFLGHPGKALHHAQTIESKSWHAHCVTKLGAEARTWITRNRNVIDFLQFGACPVKAELDRTDWQPRCVFHAIEPFLFDGRYQLAIHDHGCRGIGMIRVDA